MVLGLTVVQTESTKYQSVNCVNKRCQGDYSKIMTYYEPQCLIVVVKKTFRYSNVFSTTTYAAIP